jgi:hypothetical protein
MNWRAFFSGMAGGLLVVGTLTFPVMRAQTPWGAYPVGSTIIITSGSCPTGTAEVSAFNGAMPEGTIAANGDVGTTGGANNVTPTGSNATASFTPAGTVAAPTFTGSAGTVPAETFTGSAGTVPAETISWPAGVPMFAGNQVTTSAVSAGTPAGTNNAPAISWPAGVPTFAGSAMGTHSHGAGTLADATSGTTVKLFTASGSGASAATLSGSTAAVSAGTPVGTVAWPAGVPTQAAPTFAGSALATHTHTDTAAGTVAWPAGVPTNATASFTPAGTNATASFTPAGTNSAPAFTGNVGTIPAETWTGNNFDNRSAFVKVIFCQKT